MAVKEARQIIQEEAIQAQTMELARAIFVEPTPFASSLVEARISIRDNAPIGVATIQTLQQELELQGTPREDRRAIATAVSGGIIAGRFKDVFGMQSLLSIKTTRLPNGEVLMYRSDLKPKDIDARYDNYKRLLVEAIAEKRRPAQNRRAREEEARRRAREEDRAAHQAERKSPPIALLHFISYSSGTPEKERQLKVAIIKEGLKKGEKDKGFLVKEISDPARLFEDRSARLLAPEMVGRILEKGLTPEQFDMVVATARERLVGALRSIETYADEAALHMIADIGKAVRTAPGKKFVLPISIQRSIAPFLYVHLSYFSGIDSPHFQGETDFLIQADFGPNYPHLSYVNGLMHRFALRFAGKTLEGHKDMLEGSQEPEAVFLLKVLNQNNYGDIIALKQGGAIEVKGKSIRLTDLDSFLAPIILDDTLLIHTIFADVLGALFPLPYKLNGDERELGLAGISRMVQMLFVEEEILQLLAPDQEEPLSQQDITEELKNQIRAKENEKKGIKGSGQEANRRKNALDKEIEDLARPLRAAVRGEKKETRGEKIKRLLRERLPTKEPKPKDYEGGEESRAYKDEGFLYRIFRTLSNSPKVEFMNRDSLVSSFPF